MLEFITGHRTVPCPRKCKLIIGIFFGLLLCMFFVIIMCVTANKKEDQYTSKLISVLNKQRETSVQDIFAFKFDRAYVFNDCYISGEGLTERYHLDISITQVKTGTSENMQRIVFVDESGNFVYEYRCDSNEVLFQEKGIVVYPDTLIKRESFAKEKTMIISFKSLEHYDEDEE